MKTNEHRELTEILRTMPYWMEYQIVQEPASFKQVYYGKIKSLGLVHLIEMNVR